MPAQQRLRTRGLQQGEYVTRRLGREARDLRLAAGLGQRHLARALGVSRQWLGDFELGRLPTVDLRRVTVLFALLGHKLGQCRDDLPARLLRTTHGTGVAI